MIILSSLAGLQLEWRGGGMIGRLGQQQFKAEMTMIGRTCRARGANGKEITKIRKSKKKT